MHMYTHTHTVQYSRSVCVSQTFVRTFPVTQSCMHMYTWCTCMRGHTHMHTNTHTHTQYSVTEYINTHTHIVQSTYKYMWLFRSWKTSSLGKNHVRPSDCSFSTLHIPPPPGLCRYLTFCFPFLHILQVSVRVCLCVEREKYMCGGCAVHTQTSVLLHACKCV